MTKPRGRVRRKILIVVAVLALAATPLYLSACGTIRAGLVIRDALKPPDALAGETVTSHETVRALGRDVPVTVYRPRDEDGPLPAFVLTAGAVETGARDPRLVSLARALAAHGATVATPDLPTLRAMTLDPDDPARLAAVAGWLASRKDLAEPCGVSFIGICVGGSYAVLAAAADHLDPPPRTVIAMGPYHDLEVQLRYWMTAEKRDIPGLHDPLARGRRLVLLGNLGALIPAEDRPAVAQRIGALLDGREPADAESLADSSALVLSAAISEEPMTVEESDRLFAPMMGVVARLSPASIRPMPRCPVFLIHGEKDPIVPATESMALVRQLREQGVEVELHVTALFGHVDTGESPGLFEAWPLLSFLADAFCEAGF